MDKLYINQIYSLRTADNFTIVSGRSSRRSQEYCRQFAVRASDTLTSFVAGYKFVTYYFLLLRYLLTVKYILINCVDFDIICQNLYTASDLKDLFHNIFIINE